MVGERQPQTIVPKRRAVAIALGLFLATLTIVAPPVAAVEISPPEYTPQAGEVSVTLHFEDPDTIPLVRVLLHFECSDGPRSFTESLRIVQGNVSHPLKAATLHAIANDTDWGYGYLQGEQTGYGYVAGEHGSFTGETGLGYGYGVGGYGYGYGYQGGDLSLVFRLDPARFEPNEDCTVVVGIDAPGLAGDFESVRSDPFKPRIPPIADALADEDPPNEVRHPEGIEVVLDGRDSVDLDGRPAPLEYAWEQVSGDSVGPLGAGGEIWEATFTTPTVDDEESFVFELNVTDTLDSDTDTLTVVVHHENEPPTANAGPDQDAAEGDEVTLTGLGSTDPDGDVLFYTWELVSGPEGITFDADDATPTFAVPGLEDDVDAVFSLNVTDLADDSFDVDGVTVHLQKRPIATLESLDTEGDAPFEVTFSVGAQCFTEACAEVLLEFGDGDSVEPTTPTVKHTYEGHGDYQAVLTVTDTRGLEGTAGLDITVLPTGFPLAKAGPDQSVYEGMAVDLDGRGSYDSDGGALNFTWTQTAGPPVTLAPKRYVAQPEFTAPSLGDSDPDQVKLTFTLAVRDPSQITDTDEVNVTVHKLPAGGFATERYFLHSSGCLANGQEPDLAKLEDPALPLSARDAHASHDGEDEGTDPEMPDHLCPLLAQGALPQSVPLFPGKSSFRSEDDTDYAYPLGSDVDAHIRLAMLLPAGLDPGVVLDDASLGVRILDEANTLLGFSSRRIGYDDLAFGVPASTLGSAPEPEPRLLYADVDVSFPLDMGSLPQGSGFTFELVVQSKLANVFLEDGHNSNFTLTWESSGIPEDRPEASIAGKAQVRAGDEVTLAGEADGLDADEAGFDWYQVAGPHVDGIATVGPDLEFEAPEVDADGETLTFALQVRDTTGQKGLTSLPAEFSVKVLPAEAAGNRAPSVWANHDAAVNEGSSFVLNGFVADEDLEPFTAVWTQVSGDPAIGLTPMPGSDAALVAPQVAADRSFTFRLTATDARGASASDTMVLLVRNVAAGGTGGNGEPPGGCAGDCTPPPSSPPPVPPPSSSSSSTSPAPVSTTTSTTPSLPLPTTTTGGFPKPVGGVLGYDLSHTLRVTRVGTMNHLEWDGPGFKPLGYQVWASNSPYALLTINEGDDTDHDDANGTDATLYKVTYFTGLTAEEGFFGDAAAVFDWPEAQHAAAKKTGIPAAGFGLVALALVGAAMLLAARRRLP